MIFFIIVVNMIILFYLFFRKESKKKIEITSEELAKRRELESYYWSDRDTIRIRERFGYKFNSHGLSKGELALLSHVVFSNSEGKLMSGNEVISRYAKMKKEKEIYDKH